MENTVRYCFVIGVVRNSVNDVKDGIFKACKLIAKDGDYTAAFNISKDELERIPPSDKSI